MRLTEATVCSDSILSDVLEELNNINQYFRVLFYVIVYNQAKWMTPLWKIQKIFQKFFLFWGWVEKSPPWKLKAFWGRYFGGPENFRHFGQGTAPTHKPQS